jgi:hypothetical protein
MIPPLDEIRASLRGAILLAQRDKTGMELFNLSVDGFFRSFFAAVIAAPIYAVLLAQRYTAEMPAGFSSVLFGEIFGYVLGWVAFPVAAIFLTRLFGLGPRYVPLVVAANWAAVVQAVVFLAAAVIGGIFGPAGASILVLAAMMAVIFYEWFVMRTALDTTAGIAAGFVATDIALSFFVSGLSDVLVRS